MDKESFFIEMKNELDNIELEVEEKSILKFYNFMKLLIDWNNKINLTAIIEPKEIIIKHFIDSLSIDKYIKQNLKVIDIGTGAGFPAIPLKIVNPKINFTLLDSLSKRINFLKELIYIIDLQGVETIHARAEDLGINREYRQMYDTAVSRAVAPLNVLMEYLLPFVKVGGNVICMKGSNFKEELKQAEKAINILGGRIKKIDELILGNTDIKRSIIIIEKVKNTPEKYPRKAGIVKKIPII
ncbi:MAG: 16S rRNA (guanine(527)-N(7))-methyltransferase RsmG [Clostridia bacterium]|jgi:16S rRNA (guanine527-N7)-methyltransferase|nr:16S rRNA (guanine(527)-N(7))-methyltransferase RsmG [Clostridia bacterium]